MVSLLLCFIINGDTETRRQSRTASYPRTVVVPFRKSGILSLRALHSRSKKNGTTTTRETQFGTSFQIPDMRKPITRRFATSFFEQSIILQLCYRFLIFSFSKRTCVYDLISANNITRSRIQ